MVNATEMGNKLTVRLTRIIKNNFYSELFKWEIHITMKR